MGMKIKGYSGNRRLEMKIKRGLEKIIPSPLLNLYRFVKTGQISMQTIFDRKAYNSDLTDNEWCALLAFLLQMERQGLKPQYLEVGVFGGGTIKFLEERTDKTLFTGIDLFEDYIPSDDNTHAGKSCSLADVQKLFDGRVNLIKGDSKTILPRLEKIGKSFDMIFIDGNHTYQATLNDFNHSIPLINENGYIAFHNCSVGMSPDHTYIMRDGGPWQVTQEILRMPGFTLELEIDRIRIFSYKK